MKNIVKKSIKSDSELIKFNAILFRRQKRFSSFSPPNDFNVRSIENDELFNSILVFENKLSTKMIFLFESLIGNFLYCYLFQMTDPFSATLPFTIFSTVKSSIYRFFFYRRILPEGTLSLLPFLFEAIFDRRLIYRCPLFNLPENLFLFVANEILPVVWL